jgi:hypothetical protein
MPRINTVKKARKAQGRCTKCGKAINKGDAYRWIKPRYGSKRCVCESCQFRASDLTSSDKLGRVYDAQEDAQSAVGDWDGQDVAELRQALEDAAEAIREVAQEYQESADNIMEHFPSGNQTSEECEERANELEGWADDIEGADLDDFDPEAEGEDETDDERAERRERWVEETRDAAQAPLDDCPV